MIVTLIQQHYVDNSCFYLSTFTGNVRCKQKSIGSGQRGHTGSFLVSRHFIVTSIAIFAHLTISTINN